MAERPQIVESGERWTIYRDDSGYIRARGPDLLNGPRFAKGVEVVPAARVDRLVLALECLQAHIQNTSIEATARMSMDLLIKDALKP